MADQIVCILRNVDVRERGSPYRRGMPRSRWLLLVDIIVVLTLAGTAGAQLWVSPPVGLVGGVSVHMVLAAAFTLPLLVSRKFPVAVLAIVVASAWLQFELGGGLGQAFFAVIVALYAVGAHGSWLSTFVGPASVVLLAILVDIPRLRHGAPWDEVVPAWFILFGVWGFGRWMHVRAQAAVALTERAEEAERGRHEEALRAVTEERARIARELHDLVAHSMGVIVIQAQGAQRALDTSPERARGALSSIETTGRLGMAELRRLLGLLTDGGADAATVPQPTLLEIPELVARLRATGLSVDLSVEGAVRELPAGVELTGYRVVQEAMTNALKHAGRAQVDVQLRYEPEWFDIEVTDRGPTDRMQPLNGHDSGSRGLIGMRERVSLYGGTLEAGPRTGSGGFSVHARIPLEADSK